MSEPSEQLSPALVRVVNDKPGEAQPRPGIRERHAIPFVSEIFVRFCQISQEAIIRPPRGLLQLGRQQLLLDIIAPKILVWQPRVKPGMSIIAWLLLQAMIGSYTPLTANPHRHGVLLLRLDQALPTIPQKTA